MTSLDIYQSVLRVKWQVSVVNHNPSNMAQTEDQVLIRRCILQDAQAQRQLYDKYRQYWFMCCLRYASNKMEAEDMFQNGLISIYKDLKQYDSKKAAFSTWSYRIMINAALQYLRKWSKIDQKTISDDYAIHHSVQTDVFDELGAKELIQMVQNLPVGYRMVFNLYVIEGYRHQEIADQLGISVNTSKSQLFKAKRQLRRALEQILQKQA